jgi:outer membrane biosynthesis protein TonB
MRAATTAILLAATALVASAEPRPVGTASAKDGKASVTGSLAASTIRRHVRRALPKLVACYESTRPADGDGPEGNLNVTFTIQGTGVVTDVIAASSGLPTELEACAANVIAAIKFPRPPKRDEVRVVYPFAFAPRR